MAVWRKTYYVRHLIFSIHIYSCAKYCLSITIIMMINLRN